MQNHALREAAWSDFPSVSPNAASLKRFIIRAHDDSIHEIPIQTHRYGVTRKPAPIAISQTYEEAERDTDRSFAFLFWFLLETITNSSLVRTHEAPTIPAVTQHFSQRWTRFIVASPYLEGVLMAFIARAEGEGQPRSGHQNPRATRHKRSQKELFIQAEEFLVSFEQMNIEPGAERLDNAVQQLLHEITQTGKLPDFDIGPVISLISHFPSLFITGEDEKDCAGMQQVSEDLLVH